MPNIAPGSAYDYVLRLTHFQNAREVVLDDAGHTRSPLQPAISKGNTDLALFLRLQSVPRRADALEKSSPPLSSISKKNTHRCINKMVA